MAIPCYSSLGSYFGAAQPPTWIHGVWCKMPSSNHFHRFIVSIDSKSGGHSSPGSKHIQTPCFLNGQLKDLQSNWNMTWNDELWTCLVVPNVRRPTRSSWNSQVLRLKARSVWVAQWDFGMSQGEFWPIAISSFHFLDFSVSVLLRIGLQVHPPRSSNLPSRWFSVGNFRPQSGATRLSRANGLFIA
jgi:hypothetical protein